MLKTAPTVAPGTWMGTWSSCNYGPNISGCVSGAHVVYIR